MHVQDKVILTKFLARIRNLKNYVQVSLALNEQLVTNCFSGTISQTSDMCRKIIGTLCIFIQILDCVLAEIFKKALKDFGKIKLEYYKTFKAPL